MTAGLRIKQVVDATGFTAATLRSLEKIRRAGKTPGMPATAETLAGVLDSGCRYIYNHVPKILGAGATAFLGADRR